MEYFSKSEEDTESAGRALGRTLKPGDVVALYGGLGAGKTAFIRGMAEGMGLKARVTSPTFALVNEYRGSLPLFHFDMYRLSGPEELYDIGFEDYLESGAVCAVEWSEVVEDALPKGAIRVRIERTGDTGRHIVVEKGEPV